jgi:hypothetical protein
VILERLHLFLYLPTLLGEWIMQNIRILTEGDSSLLVEFGKEISPEINQKITATVQMLKEQHIEGVVDLIPAFCSLLINYDPRVISFEEIRERVQGILKLDVRAGEQRLSAAGGQERHRGPLQLPHRSGVVHGVRPCF